MDTGPWELEPSKILRIYFHISIYFFFSIYISLSYSEIVSGELTLILDTGPWKLEPSEIYIYIYIRCTYLSLPEIVSEELVDAHISFVLKPAIMNSAGM